MNFFATDDFILKRGQTLTLQMLIIPTDDGSVSTSEAEVPEFIEFTIMVSPVSIIFERIIDVKLI